MAGAPLPPSRPRLRLLLLRRRRFCEGLLGVVLGREGSVYIPPKTLVGRTSYMALRAPWAGPNRQRKPDLTAQMVPSLVARESRGKPRCQMVPCCYLLITLVSL